MPVLVVNRIFNSDVNFNKECYFVYDENEKCEGGESWKRGNDRCLPITIKRVPAMSVEAYWSDDNYAANCKKIQNDLDRIINVLKYGACVFIEQNFLSSESNSPMNTECPKTKEFLLEGIQLLQSRYRPFRVKT